MAAEAEQDVVAHYTGTVHPGPLFAVAFPPLVQVQLAGYDPDPAVCDPALFQVLVATVARVTAHRLEAPKPGVESERRGGRAVSYREHDARWPKGWDGLLALFDVREPLHRV